MPYRAGEGEEGHECTHQRAYSGNSEDSCCFHFLEHILLELLAYMCGLFPPRAPTQSRTGKLLEENFTATTFTEMKNYRFLRAATNVPPR